METASFPIEVPLELRLTLQPLGKTSAGTTLIRADGWWRAMRTPQGPATLHLRRPTPGRLEARGWGSGAEWALRSVPGLVGLLDRPEALVTDHPVVGPLQRRFPGLRLPRTGLVFEVLLPTIVAQKVTGREARHSLGALTAAFSGPAPGPSDGLRLPPDPERLAAAPYHAFHQMGVERRRADTIRRAAREAPRLERLARFDAEQGMRRLVSLPGVGEWTAAETVALSHGHPDAVPVGDFHVPNTVAWLLATEPRGDDRRMLELLEEFRPQRGRVIRLLEATGGRAPAFGPRLPVRSITGI